MTNFKLKSSGMGLDSLVALATSKNKNLIEENNFLIKWCKQKRLKLQYVIYIEL